MGFRERGRERERERETLVFLFHIFTLWLILIAAQTGYRPHNFGVPGQHSLFLKILFIYFPREEEEREETSMCGCLSHAPYWGPGLQPRRVP